MRLITRDYGIPRTVRISTGTTFRDRLMKGLQYVHTAGGDVGSGWKVFKTEMSTVGKKDQAECIQKICNGKEYKIMASVPPEELELSKQKTRCANESYILVPH